MVRVSQHAKDRAKERLDLSYKAERNKLFARALRYGHPPADFAGEFKQYVENRKRGKGVGAKIYDNTVFIYKNKTIITVFPVPDKYLPIREHFASYIKDNPLLMKLYEVVDKEDVCLEIITKDKENCVAGLVIEDMFENYGVGQTEIKAKNNAIRAYLKKIGKYEEGEENE